MPFGNDSYRRTIATVLVIVSGGLSVLAHAESSEPNVLWHIGGQGLFDPTNNAYAINAGIVTVDLARNETYCPTGLGHLASGRTSVKEIELRFDASRAGDYWLHISWNPGGSGKERFEAYCNDVGAGKSKPVDGEEQPYQRIDEQFAVKIKQGPNILKLRHLSGDGLNFRDIILSSSKDPSALPPALNPNLKYPTLKAYEAAIKEAGTMLDSACVRVFAPKRKESEAKTILRYLAKAYDELHKIVGLHTEYKIVVYHFPQGHPDARGGTSNCTIWYSEKNLDFQSDAEWKQYGVPHLCGYIEEMAHNFVSASKAQFGWEMIGWSIGTKVTAKVADNPIQRRRVQETRNEQLRTFNRYVQSGYRFPPDIQPNLCDRIHAHILFLCEEKYGPRFWRDFFTEIRKEQPRLLAASELGDGDEARNRRYQITIDCFDRLKDVEFKKMLKSLEISLTTDVKSLQPERPGWNRKFIP